MTDQQKSPDSLPYWVAVATGSYDQHSVIQHAEPTPETHPGLDYVVGPFDSLEEAIRRAQKERNKTGTFWDFQNDGRGRA